MPQALIFHYLSMQPNEVDLRNYKLLHSVRLDNISFFQLPY